MGRRPKSFRPAGARDAIPQWRPKDEERAQDLVADDCVERAVFEVKGFDVVMVVNEVTLVELVHADPVRTKLLAVVITHAYL